jgi:hypothetical protein
LDATVNDRPAEVSIEWHSADGLAGTMTATAADGRAYSGAYLQITPEARSDQLAPLWDGWNASRGWRAWHEESGAAFVETYDDMVLANLSAASGDRVRCYFQLDFPSLGMNGGGAGKCQFFGGRTIDAAFLPGRTD